MFLVRYSVLFLLSFACLSFGSEARAESPSYSWRTFAGARGKNGFQDGIGAEARFEYISGMAVDPLGNLYVTDSPNGVIREITAGDNVVLTIAGTPQVAGALDGPGGSAQFSAPSGLAFDGLGNLYIADTQNNNIRKIAPDRTVTTFAGQVGQAGNADGVGNAARFSSPSAMAADATGNVYVLDPGNHAIRKITPDGKVTTLTTSLSGGGGAFVLTTAGSLYFASPSTNSITKITLTGTVTNFVLGNNIQLSAIGGLAADTTGNLYILDSTQKLVYAVSSNGSVTTVANLAHDVTAGSEASVEIPSGLAIDQAGNLFISIAGSSGNIFIRKVSVDGTFSILAGEVGEEGSADGPSTSAEFQNPQGIGCDNLGNVYVTDYFNATVRKISPAGDVTTLAGSPKILGDADGLGAAAQFFTPKGLAVDPFGNVYVADPDNSDIRKIAPNGQVITFAGRSGSFGHVDGIGTNAQLSSPTSVAADGTGNLFVADDFTIRKITADGTVTTIAGGTFGSADGVGAAAQFYLPRGIAVDPADNVYVADTENETIRKILPDGTTITLAGLAGHAGYIDGPGATARFSTPSAVAVDSSGNVYVTDEDNALIRKISPAGIVETIGGTPGIMERHDGVGRAARFANPTGIAVDQSGNVYVADFSNGQVRIGTPSQSLSNTSKLINISTRAYVGPGAQTLIAGFIVSGSTPKKVLVRANGPALIPFNVPGALLDPVLTIYSGSTAIADNDDWSSNAADVTGATTLIGASPWPSGSKDAAIVMTLPPGGYTALVSGKNNSTGVALVEVYDLEAGTNTNRLINISSRSITKHGANIQIAGFIISGSERKTVLIRANGPALSKFAVPNPLDFTVLKLFSGSRMIAANGGWDHALAPFLTSAGTTQWDAGSGDSALVLSLPPGGYTAEVVSKDSSEGITLVEVYELP